MRSCVGARRLGLSGQYVTLTTHTQGAPDAEYGIIDDVAVSVTIPAVLGDASREETIDEDLAGEAALVDALFIVRASDAPTLPPGTSRPRLTDWDGTEYEVLTISPSRAGFRQLLCRTLR